MGDLGFESLGLAGSGLGDLALKGLGLGVLGFEDLEGFSLEDLGLEGLVRFVAFGLKALTLECLAWKTRA